jgi:hypothetical protein
MKQLALTEYELLRRLNSNEQFGGSSVPIIKAFEISGLAADLSKHGEQNKWDGFGNSENTNI